MNNPIEGVDYIVDHYAVLGVDPQADADTVHQAIREVRARNHPDRLGRASDEILRTAQRQTDLANRAAAVLENPERRAGYDERLAHFRQHHPELISTTGVPIVSASRQRIDVDGLLAGTPDTPSLALHSKAFAEFAQLAGHTPEALERAERLLAALPDDPDTRAMARQARVHHWIQCLVDQELAWTFAGIHNRDLKPAIDHNPYEGAAHTIHSLAHLAETVLPDLLSQRHSATALGLAPPLRLLGHDHPDADKDKEEEGNVLTDVDTQAAILKQVLTSFQERSKAVLDAAHRVQESLAQALELTPFHVFRTAPAGAPIDFILVMGDPLDDTSSTPISALRMTGTEITGSPDNARETVGAWKADASLDPAVTRVLLGHHKDIEPILAEVWWAAENLQALGLESPQSSEED